MFENKIPFPVVNHYDMIGEGILQAMKHGEFVFIYEERRVPEHVLNRVVEAFEKRHWSMIYKFHKGTTEFSWGSEDVSPFPGGCKEERW